MTNPKKTDRAQALDILIQVLEQRTPLSHLLQKPDITPLTKALCFGVIRQFVRLDALATSLVDKKPKDLIVWLCILLGLYQIDAMSMPDYAVVKETVQLLQHHKKSWAKGFVNALLRRFCREHSMLKEALTKQPDYQYNHPKWLLQNIQKAWPEDWQSIVTANDTHPPMTLRVNVKQHSRQDYSKRLNALNIDHSILEHTVAGIILHQPCNVEDIPDFVAGGVSIQDGAAQLAGSLLDLQPGLKVLDACCAPGGKTGQILELEPQLASCLAIDIDEQRLQKVQSNCDRLRLQVTLRTGDASQPGTWWDGTPFDRILLDAPCSATGIIRRHPDIKLLRSPKDIQDITAVQASILQALWPLLAVNGILIYATCSIMPEENDQQIAAFLSQHPDATVDTMPQTWGRFTGHGWQILPGEHDMDGFFYARIRKTA